MRRILLAAAAALLILPNAALAQRLEAKVSLSKQTMRVTMDGEPIYVWKVSTGKKGYETPTGSWTAGRRYELWKSKTYDNAPMPYAVFFTGGYAVHGTAAVGRLGSRASHGCVRLSTSNAKKFYDLVGEVGLGETAVTVNP